MAFENIDTNSLRTSLTACKDTINYSISDNLISNIMNDSVWLCDSRNNLRNALSELQNIYKDLENDISNFLNITSEIEEYQRLQADISNLRKEHDYLNTKLYYEEEYDYWYYNEETEKWESRPDTRTVKDYEVENKMNDISNKITENETSMESLKNRINSSV